MVWSRARLSLCLMTGMTTTGCIADAPAGDESVEIELGSRQHAIIHGTLDEGDPAVAMIRTESGRFCTGTLVAKNIVLTAAHCLDSAVPAGVGFGVDGWSTPVGVTQQIAHPQWDGQYYSGHDVGVLVLANDITHVTPVPLSGDFGAACPGAALRIVGYGYDAAVPVKSGFGVKRQAEVVAGSATDDMLIQVNQPDGTQTCHGDSGGPAFYRDDQGVERVVGVASFGNENCQGGAYFTRLAPYADFLDDFVSIVVTPAPEPPEPPLDTVAPTVSLVSPTARNVLAGKRSLVFEAQDNVGVADVVLHWSYNGKSIPCSAPIAGWTCTVSGNRYTFSAEIGKGTRSFSAEAFDEAGNITQTPGYSIRFL